MESTVLNSDGTQGDVGSTQESILDKAAATATNTTTTSNKQGEDIMSVLLAHEKKGGTNTANAVKAVLPQESSDSSDNEEVAGMQAVDAGMFFFDIRMCIHIYTPVRFYLIRRKRIAIYRACVGCIGWIIESLCFSQVT